MKKTSWLMRQLTQRPSVLPWRLSNFRILYQIVKNWILHKGAFCQFPFQWIYYYGSNKFTEKETGKMHLCVLPWPLSRVCNMVTGNPRTREKNPWKQAQGRTDLRFWDFRFTKPEPKRSRSHMVFLGNFLANPKTRKCHFSIQND